jgi:hypothetical protein
MAVDNYSIGEALLRGAPRRLTQGAAVIFAVALWTQAGWAQALLTGYATHRADAVVRTVQDSVERMTPTPTLTPKPASHPAPPTKAG